MHEKRREKNWQNNRAAARMERKFFASFEIFHAFCSACFFAVWCADDVQRESIGRTAEQSNTRFVIFVVLSVLLTFKIHFLCFHFYFVIEEMAVVAVVARRCFGCYSISFILLIIMFILSDGIPSAIADWLAVCSIRSTTYTYTIKWNDVPFLALKKSSSAHGRRQK